MPVPTAEQAFADYQAKLRQFHRRHGTTPRSAATVSTLRGVVFTGTAGR